MGEAKRRHEIEKLFDSLVGEINTAIDRFIQRRGKNPTRIFLGKTETAVIMMNTGKDPHKMRIAGTKLSIPVWTMKSSETMVDVG
jgi:hypothetical protein